MRTFRLKAPVYEAIQFTGTNFEDVMRFADPAAYRVNEDPTVIYLKLQDGGGVVIAPTDWVVESKQGFIGRTDLQMDEYYDEVHDQRKHFDISWYQRRCEELGVRLEIQDTRIKLGGKAVVFYYPLTGLGGVIGDRPQVCSPEDAIRWAARKPSADSIRKAEKLRLQQEKENKG